MYEIESIFLNHPVLFYNKCAVGRCLHSVFRQNLSPQRLLRIFFLYAGNKRGPFKWPGFLAFKKFKILSQGWRRTDTPYGGRRH